ncbi:MAG TPA: bacillithiol biosynthesis BshC, partial [Gemmatimonadales bacterium]|nr:bacillithiol biosynthesis BshC [Gemmatimonadales bacterium]
QSAAMVREWLGRHWIPGRSIGTAYAGSLAELLAPLGIVAFDPTHRAAKRVMARHLVKALGLARDLDRDLATRAAELARTGDDGGVVVGDGATLVMIEGREGRDRLVVDGETFVTRRSGEAFSLDQLQGIAASEPERLSPNVLLRPVVEAAILPTVAYIGGPGELGYWRLTPPIYARMRIEPQLALPRWSGMIVEPMVARLLTDLSTDLDELLAPSGALETRLARGEVPTELADAYAHLQASVARDFEVMRRKGGEIAPQLARALETLERRITWLAGRAEGKVLAHVKRRGSETVGRIRRARESLRPLGRPQERVFTVAPFLAHHGPGLLPELAATIRAWYAAALEGRGTTP